MDIWLKGIGKITVKDLADGCTENVTFHREDGPAIIKQYKNGNILFEKWYIDGKLHRKDGPAVIYYNDKGDLTLALYYDMGVIHNENGPARLVATNGGTPKPEYYFMGELCLQQEFEELIRNSKIGII